MISVFEYVIMYEECFKYLGYFSLVHSIAEEKKKLSAANIA